jgi:hypothetical protein
VDVLCTHILSMYIVTLAVLAFSYSSNGAKVSLLPVGQSHVTASVSGSLPPDGVEKYLEL